MVRCHLLLFLAHFNPSIESFDAPPKCFLCKPVHMLVTQTHPVAHVYRFLPSETHRVGGRGSLHMSYISIMASASSLLKPSIDLSHLREQLGTRLEGVYYSRPTSLHSNGHCLQLTSPGVSHPAGSPWLMSLSRFSSQAPVYLTRLALLGSCHSPASAHKPRCISPSWLSLAHVTCTSLWPASSWHIRGGRLSRRGAGSALHSGPLL